MVTVNNLTKNYGDYHLNILRKMYCRFDEEFFQKKCTSLGLPMNKQLKNFSTGMKAKLRVLSAICHNAKLLILDEPTAGLDVEARNEILNMLREYVAADEERSILISSHISSDLENLCDNIYLLSNGKMIVHEDTDRILSEYAILKLNEIEYNCLDKEYILATRKETFGYVCFTDKD